LNNWSFRQVITFLKDFHFQETHSRGSHHYFCGVYNGIPRMVTVPKRGSIKTGTMKGIIVQSGIPESLWRKKI
jgi:predicted RNA binding protein YcfA (HicA-like mRNA interferase family)